MSPPCVLFIIGRYDIFGFHVKTNFKHLYLTIALINLINLPTHYYNIGLHSTTIRYHIE